MANISNNEYGLGSLRVIIIVLFSIACCAGIWIVYRFLTAPTGPVVKDPISGPALPAAPAPTTYTDPADIYAVTCLEEWKIVQESSSLISIPLPVEDNKTLNFIPPDASDNGFVTVGIFSLIPFKSDPGTVLADTKHGNIQTSPRSLDINGYQALYQQDISTYGVTFVDDEYAIYHNGITLYLNFREKEGVAPGIPPFNASSYLPSFMSTVDSVKFLN